MSSNRDWTDEQWTVYWNMACAKCYAPRFSHEQWDGVDMVLTLDHNFEEQKGD